MRVVEEADHFMRFIMVAVKINVNFVPVKAILRLLKSIIIIWC
jgi:hypothetical protein